MSKFLTALNQIEQEKSPPNVRSVSIAPPSKKSSFDRLWKFIFPVLLITCFLVGAYFFGKYQPLSLKTQKTSPGPAPLASFFTIQLITYQTELRATEQALKLATEGHKTFVVSKDGYFQVCLGRFPNQSLADEERAKLKDTLPDYKGMYVRFIQNPQKGSGS